MANYREDIINIDLENGNLHRSFLQRSIGMGDEKANRFGVRVFRDKVPVSLSGSCKGYFIRSDGETVTINDGVISGNVAYVILPSGCYAVEGCFTLAIKVTTSGETITMRIVDGMVTRTATTVVADPGQVVLDIETLLQAIEDAVATIPQDYSGMKQTLAAEDDLNGEVSSKIVFELGGVSTDDGSETTRSDCVRTQYIPIGEGDTIQCIRVDNDDKASGWWANAHYYDEDMVYIASVRPGTGQYNGSFMRVPSLTYANAAFVRFSILTTAGNVASTYQDIYKCFVRRGVIKSFTQKLEGLQKDYDIYDLDFTNAGGISNGTPYDSAEDSKRFRTTAAYPFPMGSMIVMPDNLMSIYDIWFNMYWDAGRYDKSYFGEDTVRLEEITANSFAEQDINYYAAISGKTLDNYTVLDDNVAELNKIIKIAVPKKKGETEERLSGEVTAGGYVPYAGSLHQ